MSKTEIEVLAHEEHGRAMVKRYRAFRKGVREFQGLRS